MKVPMNVGQVMTTKVVSVKPDATLKETALALLQNRVSGVPVVDDEGHLLGIVSEADLLPRAVPEDAMFAAARELLGGSLDWDGILRHNKSLAMTAGELMTSPVQATTPQVPLREVARRLSESGLRRLPVVEHGKVVGMLTRHDVLKVFCASDPETQRSVEAVLERRGFVPPRHSIDVAVHEGVVTLSGSNLGSDSLRRVLALVGAVDGVVAARNSVHVEPSRG